MPRCSASAPIRPACWLFQFGIGFWPAIVSPAPSSRQLFGGSARPAGACVSPVPYLAMVTLAFGTIVQILINEMTFLTNGPPRHHAERRRGLIATTCGPTGTRLPFLAHVAEAHARRRVSSTSPASLRAAAHDRGHQPHHASRFGRAFEALRDAPIACDCMAVSVYRHKVHGLRRAQPPSPASAACCSPTPSNTSRPTPSRFDLSISSCWP